MQLNPYVEPRRRLFKAVFIDGSYLFHSLMSLSVKLDYKKLIGFFLNEGDHLVTASYYTALPKESEIEDKHRGFIRVLKKDVKLKIRSVPLLKMYAPPNAQSQDPTVIGRYSKGEDILLACDMVRGAALNYFDEAVLISGDADMLPAVNMVQELGKTITVAAFRFSLSGALELEANAVTYLDDHVEDLRLMAFDDIGKVSASPVLE